MTGRGLRRYLDDLLGGRRPRPFRAGRDDADALRVALELRAARPDAAAAPRPGFVDELHRRLAAELDPTAPASASPDATAPDATAPDEPAPDNPAPDVTAPDNPAPAAGPVPATGPAAPDPAVPDPAVRPPTPLGRRRLILHGAGLAAASAAVGAAAGAGVDHALRGGAAPGSGTLTPAAGTWQTVAASAELPEGAVRAFDLGTVAGFVHRAGGAVRAVSGTCTHQGCRLRLDAARNLDCPCHTTVFAASGELITHQLPTAPPPLPQFAAREVDGAVQVYGPAV